MKKTQRDPVYKIDEFEDLTLFANESFDTEDVDLFEFSSEESSPLMQLKSIILSLDWEINDEILQELADELENLESVWQNDKVADVYLQGLSKLGGYIRAKGAYAHHNSIKLLLTFFYNFEKIISSPNITGEEITQILAGDVRKFRILQYQINLSEAEPSSGFDEKISDPAAAVALTAPLAQTDHAKQLNAAILSLDWEVTDESLKQFDTSLSLFNGMFTDNKPALVLLQGLQVLGDYIAEKRAKAHPEAFILLHSFFEALAQVATTGEQALDQNTMQDLLTDRISRINNLKMLVASQVTSPLDAQIIDTFVDEISTQVASPSVTTLPPKITTAAPIVQPVSLQTNLAKEVNRGDDRTVDSLTDTIENEIDTLFAMDSKPAMETAFVQYPDDILSPDAIHPVDDELADDFIEAHLSTKRGLMPALSDTEETSGFNEAAQPLDLPTQMDLAEQLDFLFPEGDTDTEKPPTMSPALDASILEITTDDAKQPVAALADVNPEDTLKERDFIDTDEPDDEAKLSRTESEIAQSASEIQSKLDDFFADTIAEPIVSETTVSLSAEDHEQSLFFDEESGVESALADSKENHGFSEEEAKATLDYTPMGEIEEKLDFFFGASADEEPVAAKPPEPASKPEGAPITSGDSLDKELEGALDFIFDADEDDIEASQPAGTDELTQALEANLDGSLTPALDLAQEKLPPTTLMPEETRHIQMAALGALLPGVVLTLSREKAAESAQLIATLKNAELSSGQQALAQLLNSVISLHVRLPKRNEAVTEKLVNYLYEHLLDNHCPPEILLEAVNRFTEWLLDAFAIMPPAPTTTSQEDEPRFEYTAKELYVELSELRGHINEEFAKLRHEMRHKH